MTNQTSIAGAPTPWQTAIREMLAEPSFCFPIAAAQVQFRERYYGLSAASLLEDLFFDALTYFTRQNCPQLVPVRPPRGEKGYDYSMDGTTISHKVGKPASPIAVLWDATRRIETWSANASIVYHRFDGSGRQREASIGSKMFTVRPVTNPDQRVFPGTTALIVRWRTDGVANVLSTTPVDSMRDLITPKFFERVWLDTYARSGPANEVDILLSRKSAPVDVSSITDGAELKVENASRPGIYFFDPDMLTNVALTANNRAQLIPAPRVDQAMDEARASGRFVPLPTWFSLFAQSNPPNLFLAQKSQFDDMFK